MRKTHDIMLIPRSGKHRNSKFGFTLALRNAQKAWRVQPVSYDPPAIEKEQIDMVITARERNFNRTGRQELTRVNKIMEQLAIVADAEEGATLKGLDNIDRQVYVAREGYEQLSVVNEKGKDPEYQVTLTVWSVYE